MNIAYLLYREDIFSPLVEGQVLNILYRIVKRGVTVHFIWLKRIDYCIKYQDKIDCVRRELKENGIMLHEIPVFVGKFPLKKGMSDFVYAQAELRIHSILKKYRIDILHTRGYNAGLMATKLLKKRKIAKHIFDPRSPYLTELISTYGVKEGEEKYEFWLNNEKLIVEKADITISVSQTFADYLKQYKGDIVIIPNNSEMDDPSIVERRAIRQRRKSFCFVGSLGYGWNNVHEYIAFMQKVWKLCPDIHLELYVLKQSIVREELRKAGISEDRYTIKTLPQSEVGETISGCLAGLQIMSKADTRLGIKTVDYLAAGIPVICNDNAMGAAWIVDQYCVGWNVDRCNLSNILEECISKKIREKSCISLAYETFSTEAVSQKYFNLYHTLIQ